MHVQHSRSLASTIAVLGLSVLVVMLAFAWQGNKGFSLWDEGFLWYGAQRVLQGEVPIRDFMSYDPGRYYWSAAWMSLFGDGGIQSLRVAVAIFQALGVFCAVLLIAGGTRSPKRSEYIFWLVAAATFLAWMYPRHKLFDISLSIFLIGGLTLLVQRPAPRRYLFAGVCLGLVAVFGRNHGLYGLVGSLGVLAWLNVNRSEGPSWLKGCLIWGAGVLLGYAPVLLMLVLLPGFALSFWESILFLFEQKATNLPLPVPWPWTIDTDHLPIDGILRGLLIGTFFLVVPIFGGLGVIWAFLQRWSRKEPPPALIASIFLTIPYAHYAFSRADVGHLAQGLFPFLVSCFVLLSRCSVAVKWGASLCLCVASLWVMHVFHPGWQCREGRCHESSIYGSTVFMEDSPAENVKLLQQLVDLHAPDGQPFMVAPFWPGAYPLFGQRSPVWEIYALSKRSEAFEREEIDRIKSASPSFVLVVDIALDGRDELRYKNTHPVTYRFLQDNYDLTPTSAGETYRLYKPRSADPVKLSAWR